MPLIDRTYFDGPLILDVKGNEAAIDAAIADYEPRYLRAVLGPSLYAAFAAGIIAGNRSYFSAQFSDQFLKSPLDDRWRWLKEGHTFTVGGRPYVWPGFAVSRNSPAAAYVYWHYRRDTSTFTTGVGEARLQSENGSIVSPARKMVNAWNQMVDAHRELLRALPAVTDDDGALIYPEFVRYELCRPDSVDVFSHQNANGI